MKATTMRSLRKWHHYLGVFFAPLILLFAVSGALQTFRLQEAKGYGGTSPDWIVWLASIHKDQAQPRESEESLKVAPTPAPTVNAGPSKAGGHKHARSLPLEIFVVVMALALTLSTLLGVIIAFNNRATRTISIALLVAGAVLPLVLLKF